ncbi:helix-turn-helix domain-containing protein [Streptomyces sp. NPDC006477]|uniref:helix-turn-helix domain-containing protein n=1 Tax=Streptomyces sp. NPDC006477 TaxID=3364747 RepID=UPI0036738D1B
MDPVQKYRLINPELMRTLMQRTGTGSSISNRELAVAAGVSHGTIDNILRGISKIQKEPVASAICRTIGVDLLILWAPIGRAVPADDDASPSHRLTVAS